MKSWWSFWPNPYDSDKYVDYSPHVEGEGPELLGTEVLHLQGRSFGSPRGDYYFVALYEEEAHLAEEIIRKRRKV